VHGVEATVLSQDEFLSLIKTSGQDLYDETTDLEVLIQKVNEVLAPRLSASVEADAMTEEEEEDSGSEDAEEDEEESNLEGDGAEGEQEVLDVGHSKLRQFYNFINNKDELDSWLKSETEKYKRIEGKEKKTAREAELIRYTPEQKLKSALISLLRPAMIVDGQHRVMGAYDVSDDIEFTVCAIRDADWVEQVSQFVILNKLAKPISGDFLTALLNTSLTNKELKVIEERLDRG
jgi:hypothetical protein